MAKVIDKTVLSRKSHKTSALWAYPKDNDSVELRIFNNGEWQNISGTGKSNSSSSSSSDSGSDTGGSGCNCNTEEPILLTGDTNVQFIAAKKIIAEEGYDVSNIEDLEAWAGTLPAEEIRRIDQIVETRRDDVINSLSITTENHGKVVQISGNLKKFLCEDGFILEIVNGDLVEYPPHTRYYFVEDSHQVYDILTSNPVELSTIHNITDVIRMEEQGREAFFHLDGNGQGYSLWHTIYTGWESDEQYAGVAELKITYGGDIDSATIDYIPLERKTIESFPK